MVARLRRKGDPTPAYGDTTEEFTVEVHHGGFFLGFGHLRSYVDERIDWFDGCEVDTWSPLWFDDFIEQLGYTKTPLLRVYWLLPGKQLADGLRVIEADSDTNAMCSVVDRVKKLVVYFDHEDCVASVVWDGIVANPEAYLPKVLSPLKVQQIEEYGGEKLPDFYRNLSLRMVRMNNFYLIWKKMKMAVKMTATKTFRTVITSLWMEMMISL